MKLLRLCYQQSIRKCLFYTIKKMNMKKTFIILGKLVIEKKSGIYQNIVVVWGAE